jgi:hypothetical protein
VTPSFRTLAFGLLVAGAAGVASGQEADPGVLLEVQFTPAPRAQIAIWIESEDGRFLRTLALTEAVAYRGIGNRPGASQMNSGYRWPYGRREGVLPVWATRRAAAPGARQFRRVIFQNRTSEGLASRTSADHSVDTHFCLSFNQATTKRDALDAVSCASVFTSDKGRFMTEADLDNGYGEPYEDPVSHVGMRVPLSLDSLYPPRRDVTRCTASGCFDHIDVGLFAAHAREVMPDIDAVTTATPPGGEAQSLLFSLPANWPKGRYALYFEINVEGDYNDTYNESTFATPEAPVGAWDSWAIDYGYAYRGQPSLVFALPFEVDLEGEATYAAAEAVGRSSWDVWSDGYGGLESMSGISDDAEVAPASGVDRLKLTPEGQRLGLHVTTLSDRPDAPPEPDGGVLPEIIDDKPDASGDPQQGGEPADGDPPADDPQAQPAGSDEEPVMPETEGEGVILPMPGASRDGPVGPVLDLSLRRHPNNLHSHEWLTMRFRAATSEQPLHRYEVRVSTEPIVDEETFLRLGRPAKRASLDAEGATSLMLPAKTAPGTWVEADIGDLVAETRHYVGVRAVDRLDRKGPISVALLTTTSRTFSTVSPCFIATAAYGTPLAPQVGVLRRVRDRYLMSHAPGRALVAAYYARGQALAEFLRDHASLRAAVRRVLEPIVAIADLLVGGRSAW